MASQESHSKSTAILYIVATPIGNLKDITLRALETLREVAVIYCEDTRRARILCDHYAITAPLRSCHAHSERRTVPAMLRLLRDGASCAYICDAGTPTISDPGGRLVEAARADGFRVTPIPGASAVHALISASGENACPYLCYGFLPRGAGKRKRILLTVLEQGYPVVLFESPYRIVALALLLVDCAPRRVIVIGRELTKKFEEIRTGTAEEHHRYFSEKKVRGELTVLVTNRKLKYIE